MCNPPIPTQNGHNGAYGATLTNEPDAWCSQDQEVYLSGVAWWWFWGIRTPAPFPPAFGPPEGRGLLLARVAQLVEASDSRSGWCGFESHQGHAALNVLRLALWGQERALSVVLG
jgi:hypothetical protein